MVVRIRRLSAVSQGHTDIPFTQTFLCAIWHLSNSSPAFSLWHMFANATLQHFSLFARILFFCTIITFITFDCIPSKQEKCINTLLPIKIGCCVNSQVVEKHEQSAYFTWTAFKSNWPKPLVTTVARLQKREYSLREWKHQASVTYR